MLADQTSKTLQDIYTTKNYWFVPAQSGMHAVFKNLSQFGLQM